MFIAAIVLAATFPTITQIPTVAKPLNPSPTVTKFTFVVAGDNRPDKPADGLTKPLTDIIAALVKSPPALVVWNGDTISGKVASTAPAQYTAFLGAFKNLPVPVFNAPGNHELVHDITCTSNGKSTGGEYPFQDVLSAYTTSMLAPPYGMFRYGNAAFVIVNTDELLGSVTLSSQCLYNGFVSSTQLSALTATLQALDSDTTVTHTFLFMHRPIHDQGSHQIGNGKSDTSAYGTQVEAFRHAVDKGGYKKLLFVFASHDHRLAVFPAGATTSGTSPGKGGEPTFVITGGAGAPLSGCSKGGSGKSGAYYHYLSVAVDGANVTVTPVPLYGTKLCTQPPGS